MNTINPIIINGVTNHFWYLTFWTTPRAGVKLDTIPSCINFIGVTFTKMG